MNRQQRRNAERSREKDAKTLFSALADPGKAGTNETVIRMVFNEGQIVNNHEWAVRLERIRNVRGIGPEMLRRIFKAIEEPLEPWERERAKKSFESGADYIGTRN